MRLPSLVTVAIWSDLHNTLEFFFQALMLLRQLQSVLATGITSKWQFILSKFRISFSLYFSKPSIVGPQKLMLTRAQYSKTLKFASILFDQKFQIVIRLILYKFVKKRRLTELRMKPRKRVVVVVQLFLPESIIKSNNCLLHVLIVKYCKIYLILKCSL